MGSSLSKPDFVTVLGDKQMKIGEDVSLRCEVNTAELTATWQKNGKKLYCVDGKHCMIQKCKVFILEIKNAEEGDDGVYTLQLENREGTASCSATVSVECSEWRGMQWNQGEMISTLQNFKIRHNTVKELNFLLYGPIGAGKSSIINTIKSIFEGHLYANILPTSCTLSFEKYVLGKDGVLPLAFHDLMGIETGDQGVHTEDVISALKGLMKKGYKFVSSTPLSENNQHYRQNPSLSDRVHCLVNVIPADKVSVMDDHFKKMKQMRDIASKEGIPQVVLMTRVDLCCPLTNKNLQNVYKSKKIKEKMSGCSVGLGVPMKCIFPVWNYHEETELKEEIHCLMLYALTKIVHFANDYVVQNSNKQEG